MKPFLFRRALLCTIVCVLPFGACARGQNAAPVDVGVVLQLDDAAFHSRVQNLIGYRNTITLPDLWRVLADLERRRVARAKTQKADAASLAQSAATPEQRRASVDEMMAYRRVCEAISAVGGEEDYARMLKLFDRLRAPGETNEFLPGSVFEPLSDFWLRREFSRPGALPKALDIVASGEALPKNLQTSAPALQNAWRLYRGVKAAFPDRTRRPDNWIPAQENWPLFYATLNDVLHEREGSAEKVARFEWDGWCGTGSEQLYAPKSRAIFMALWQAHRYNAALGALLTYADNSSRYSRFDGRDDAQRLKFVQACGVDWQTLYAGAMLDGDYGRAWASRELGAHGDERGARLLLAMKELPGVAARTDYLNAVGALIMPAPSETGATPLYIGEIRRETVSVLPSALERELLEILHAQLRPETSRETVERVAGILSVLRRPESRDVLRRALDFPSSRARESAAQALREMGEDVTARPSLPVELRVLRNGAPWRRAQVNYRLSAGENSSTFSSGTTDENGALMIDRDIFSDAQNPIRTVKVSSGTMQTAGDLWFDATSPAPANLDAGLSVQLVTAPLTLRVRGDKLLPGAFARLKVARPQIVAGYYETVSGALLLPPDGVLRFENLELGQYQLEVFAPGAARWESPELKLQAPLEVEAQLQPGTDLRFHLLAPGGAQRDPNPNFDLLRDGKPLSIYTYYDYQARVYRGLPLGRYTIRVAARDGHAARDGSQNTHPAYQKLEREFVVDGKAEELDLGEIALVAQ